MPTPTFPRRGLACTAGHAGSLLAILSVAALPACITQTQTHKTGLTRSSEPVAPPAPGPNRPADPAPAVSSAAPGPVARPVQSARTRDTRVRVAVRPIGRVPYDGLTLPITSPDGRCIASQIGPAPGWDALLAQDRALVNPGTRLAAFALSEQGLAPLSGPDQLPTGLLLGRSADDRGFLVESPRPDGTRRIGYVQWVSARLTWLVDDEFVNAFATLGPTGELIYSRRSPATRRWQLVIRPDLADPARQIVVDSPRAESILVPLCGLDRAHVYAMAVDARGVGANTDSSAGAGADDSLAVLVISLGGTDAKAPAGQIVARVRLGVESTIAAAFQAVAPMQTPWPGTSKGAGLLGAGVAVVSARAQSAVWVGSGGELLALARDSASAVPLVSPGAVGLIAATGREVVFHVERTDPSALGVAGSGTGEVRWGQEASILASGAVPRASLAITGQVLLIEPPQSVDDRTLGILLMQPTNDP